MPAYDAIVVGARVAGAATALQLARRGHRVLVLERAPRGSDTLSTHALMRTGVLLLDRWGLLGRVVDAATPPVHRVTFHYRDEAVPLDLDQPLYAPRRTVLDPILGDAAAEAGADVGYGIRVNRLLRDGDGRVRGVRASGPYGSFEASATVTIGADGMRSLVAREVAAPVTRAGSASGAFIYGYWTDIEIEGIEYHFADGVSAGFIPTNDGRTCVYISASSERFLTELRFDLESAFDRVLREAPRRAAALVATGTRVSRLRGFPGVPGRFHRPYGPGWALVGDAGYFKDPQSAHGITDALRDAELLSRALDAGLTAEQDLTDALAEYERTRNDLSVPLFTAADDIAGHRWSLDVLPSLHIAMSKAMQRETAYMAALTAPITTAALAA